MKPKFQKLRWKEGVGWFDHQVSPERLLGCS